MKDGTAGEREPRAPRVAAPRAATATRTGGEPHRSRAGAVPLRGELCLVQSAATRTGRECGGGVAKGSGLRVGGAESDTPAHRGGEGAPGAQSRRRTAILQDAQANNALLRLADWRAF